MAMSTQATLSFRATPTLPVSACRPRTAHLSPLSAHTRRLSLRFSSPSISVSPKLRISASLSRPTCVSPNNSALYPNPLSGSTRTITTLFPIALTVAKLFPRRTAQLEAPLLSAAGPAFFAATKDGYLNTPLTVVAAGMEKWLNLYSEVLRVRILLGCFPNIPWDRQPLSAIRDLCDPFLNLFRNIIPPIFDIVDVSPLLAFAVLGFLGSILNSSRPSF